VQQQTSPIPETRVIAYATYASKAFRHRSSLTLALLGGMALGVGFGMLRELLTERSERVGRHKPRFSWSAWRWFRWLIRKRSFSQEKAVWHESRARFDY